ncbi:MAG: T9SS type A sorting domain-containing protein [candidate division WOR-3 bacterium]|nr:MAG: T9SS type A sorting domain-containing protein [candidate division WOR-3 bacterium]
MKYITVLILLMIAANAADLDLVRIDVVGMGDIKSLDRIGVIINQVHPDHIVAEISKDMYQIIAARGHKVELIQENITEVYRQNSMMRSSRSEYLNYTEFVDSMIVMAGSFPDICRLDTLGYSHQNRLLLIMKISDNVNTDEDEPEVHIEGNVHGDEKIGWAMCLWLIRDLLQSYSSDTLVQRLVDTREIWIAPLVNPDGFAAGIRYNSRNVDLNRNCAWMWGDEYACGTDFISENESRRFVEHFWRRSFVTYVSYHAGTLFISEPWSYTSNLQPPEQNLIRHLSEGYAVPTNYPYGQGSVGMYPINGCTKDFGYGYGGEISWSVEVCDIKTPPPDSIDAIWPRERAAMLWLIHKAGQGIHGHVYDSLSVDSTGLRALVYVEPAYWHSYAKTENGDFHRFYLPGTYTVTAFSPGYIPKTINNVIVPSGTPDSSVTIEFPLVPDSTLPIYATDLIGNRYVNTYTNLTYPTQALGPHDNGSFQLDTGKWIVLHFDVPIRNFPGNDIMVYRPSGSGVATVKVSNDWSGSWQTLGTANAAVTQFDLGTTTLDSARYVRVEAASQFMLDAVEALQVPTGITSGENVPTSVEAGFGITPTVLRKGEVLRFTSTFAVPVEVRLFNLLGQVVGRHVIGSGMTEVSLMNLPAGVYFVSTSDAQDTQRLILID